MSWSFCAFNDFFEVFFFHGRMRIGYKRVFLVKSIISGAESFTSACTERVLTKKEATVPKSTPLRKPKCILEKSFRCSDQID